MVALPPVNPKVHREELRKAKPQTHFQMHF